MHQLCIAWYAIKFLFGIIILYDESKIKSKDRIELVIKEKNPDWRHLRDGFVRNAIEFVRIYYQSVDQAQLCK